MLLGIRGEHNVRNTAIMLVLAVGLSIFGMWKMDYLGSPRDEYVRMTDSARNAYVAKNLVEGNGYTTNDLPAALLGFYQQRGKLAAEHWPNADRFPFTTVAIAGLYTITGTTSWFVGITIYNIIAFSILLTLIYRLSWAIFKNHYSGVLAVTMALVHPGTWLMLYQKDADSVALSVGVLIALIRWLDKPRPERVHWGFALGTLLAWLFLARPNVGMPFLVFLLVELVRWVRDPEPFGAKWRVMLRVYGALAIGFAVWTVPYAIYSLATWGSPFFSANSLYQLPLGTRLSLGGDTWWKYYGPDRVLSFGSMMSAMPGEIIWKVSTSWILTFRLCLSSYITEICVVLMAKLSIWRRGAMDRDARPRDSVRTVGRVLFAIVLFNFLILPLFGWAYFPWKQYLVFAMPWVWCFVGHAIYRFIEIAKTRWRKDVSGQYFWLFVAFIVVVVLTGRDEIGGDGTFVTPTFAKFVWQKWQFVAIAIGLVALLRPKRLTPLRAAALSGLFILAVWRPAVELKADSINYYPLSKGVEKTLRERTGLVSSLALQSEVSWLSNRRHVPVPENALLLYNYKTAFGLDVEDVYIESAATMTGTEGPFEKFMPSLESYARLERYQAPLPGYSIVFHETGQMGYPQYRVGPRMKASTIYRFDNPAARDAVQHSPDAIALGDVQQAIFATHGFGGYFDVEGHKTIAQTSITRGRYKKTPNQRPHEDASISFFLDARKPRQVTLSLYVLKDVNLDVYWNLDLDAFDAPKDRKRHQIGTITATESGWQTVTLDVPAALVRTGLNKVGVRASNFIACASCLAGNELCAMEVRDGAKSSDPKALRRFATQFLIDVGELNVSSFFESIRFTY